MMTTGLIWGMAAGRSAEVVTAMTEGAAEAIQLTISIGGTCLLWMGIAEIAAVCGLTDRLSKLVGRPFSHLFPDSPDAVPAITMSFTANFLGLGSAAMPFGLEAMTRMSKSSSDSGIATPDMVMFIVLNAASIELIPTNVIALRAAAGSEDIYCVVLPTFIISVICTLVGAITVKLIYRRRTQWR